MNLQISSHMAWRQVASEAFGQNFPISFFVVRGLGIYMIQSHSLMTAEIA